MNKNWLNSPEIKAMSPVKQAFLTNLMKETQTTSQSNLPMLYMKAMAQMKSQNLQFTVEESAIITEIIESQMSAAERTRFQAVRKMLQK